jgi:alkyl sulfatase BDS1-like metallo-beta-lactamase superfamily hydrolase
VNADESTAGATVKVANNVRLLGLAAGDMASPGFELVGDAAVLQQLTESLDKPDPGFNIVTP